MKNRSLSFLFLITFLVLAQLASAQSFGPNERKFGVGAFLGEPLSATVKWFPLDKLGIQGSAGWSFVEGGFSLIADATYDVWDIPLGSQLVRFPLYGGLGFKTTLGQNFSGGSTTGFALQAPVGVSARWNDSPLEIYAEFAPGIQFEPKSAFDFRGGLGVRWYLF